MGYRFAAWVGVVGALLSCAHPALATPSPETTAACNPPSGWEAVAEAAEGRVLFVGEIHGNAETPDAFARYVCAAAAQGGSTLVLLELPPHHEPAMREATASDDPRAALLTGLETHWKTQDGRGSGAMLDMMSDLMSLAKTNTQLSIEPFSLFLLKEFPTPEETMEWVANLSADEMQEQGEAGMAKEILRRSVGYDRTIVLVGNVHAAQVSLSGGDVASAAMRVPGAISLNVVHDGGDSWVHGNSEAGAQTVSPLNPQDEPADTMALSNAYNPHFHGFLSVGTISASPPALSGTP